MFNTPFTLEETSFEINFLINTKVDGLVSFFFFTKPFVISQFSIFFPVK